MEERIFNLPNAPLPLDPDSYYEVLVPDGASATGYTSCKIKPGNIDGVKRYKALITQNGSPSVDPTVKVLENTIGTITQVYTGVGTYTLSSAGLFTLNKTSLLIGSASDVSAKLYFNQSDINDLVIYTDSGGSPSDGMISDTTILIEVYP
jgi:hypothetical protein